MFEHNEQLKGLFFKVDLVDCVAVGADDVMSGVWHMKDLDGNDFEIHADWLFKTRREALLKVIERLQGVIDKDDLEEKTGEQTL